MEDIQGLAAIGKKAPKPQFMATYYAKLTRIFTVSDSHLYNGCAPAPHLAIGRLRACVLWYRFGSCLAVSNIT